MTTYNRYGLHLLLPQIMSLNVAECTIAVIACLMIFPWKRSMVLTLGLSALLGAVRYLATTPR
jgi:hypothetical protein